MKIDIKWIKRLFKKDTGIIAIQCYRRNVSCKNCYKLGK